MTEIRTRYNTGVDVTTDTVRISVQVQAPAEELADLVEVVAARLEDAGLTVVERSAPAGGGVALILTRAAWLGASPLP